MSTFVATIRAKGLRGTSRALADRVEEAALEAFWEWKLGIATSGRVTREHLGYDDETSSFYAPSAYGNIRRILRALEIRPGGNEVLVDFGCGKGRVLVMAARLPLARVVGIERSPELAAVARRNVDRARGHGVLTPVEIVITDAAAYEIPADATIVYFASPFSGQVLDAVLDHVKASHDRSPRPIRLVSHGYDAANAFESQIRRREWIDMCTEVKLLRSNCAWIYGNYEWSA